jgi:hypothetical protein
MFDATGIGLSLPNPRRGGRVSKPTEWAEFFYSDRMSYSIFLLGNL